MLNQILSSSVWQTVGALIAIITAAITIITFIHKSPIKTKKLFYVITIFLTVLVIAGTSGVIYVLSSSNHSPTIIPGSLFPTSIPVTTSTSPVASSSPTPSSTATSTPTPTPIPLGPVDLNRYCQSLGDVRESLDGSTAYDWHCVTSSGNHVNIDIIKACQLEYNRSDATAIASNINDPSSWKCYYFNYPLSHNSASFPGVFARYLVAS